MLIFREIVINLIAVIALHDTGKLLVNGPGFAD
jgi:hypothetical protein